MVANNYISNLVLLIKFATNLRIMILNYQKLNTETEYLETGQILYQIVRGLPLLAQSFTRAPEDQNVVTNEIQSSFNLIQELCKEKILYKKVIKVNFRTKYLIIGGKIVSLFLGNNGFRHYCHVSSAGANALRQIESPFDITKDYNSGNEI